MQILPQCLSEIPKGHQNTQSMDKRQKCLTVNNVSITEVVDVAKHFNEIFNKVVDKLDSNLPHYFIF